MRKSNRRIRDATIELMEAIISNPYRPYPATEIWDRVIEPHFEPKDHVKKVNDEL